MTSESIHVRLSADYPEGALRTPHHHGELIRIRRGAYVPVAAPDDLRSRVRDRCMAVTRRLRVHFAFSHETATVLHGLPTFTNRSDAVHIVQEVRPSGHSASDIVRHVARLPAADVTTVQGLPLTTLDRTCVDFARMQSPAQSLAVADAILRQLAGTTRFAWPQASDAEKQIRKRWLARIEELGRAQGVARARTVVAHAEGRSESPAESRVRWLVLIHGFAKPGLQMPISTDLGTFYPDLLWSGEVVRSQWQAIALEYDGVAKYEQAKDLFEEKRREDALRSVGCLVIRATKDDLRRPHRILRELRAHVAQDPRAGAERRDLLNPP